MHKLFVVAMALLFSMQIFATEKKEYSSAFFIEPFVAAAVIYNSELGIQVEYERKISDMFALSLPVYSLLRSEENDEYFFVAPGLMLNPFKTGIDGFRVSLHAGPFMFLETNTFDMVTILSLTYANVYKSGFALTGGFDFFYNENDGQIPWDAKIQVGYGF